MKMQINLHENNQTTFANGLELEKHITKKGFDKFKWIQVYTKNGRATAVFPTSHNSNLDVPSVCGAGFIVV